jgi:hypothetical protein
MVPRADASKEPGKESFNDVHEEKAQGYFFRFWSNKRLSSRNFFRREPGVAREVDEEWLGSTPENALKKRIASPDERRRRAPPQVGIRESRRHCLRHAVRPFPPNE